MRTNKTRKQIVANHQQVESANRMRGVLREKVYPFLRNDLNESIGYTKIFLQACAGALSSAYEERQRATKISEFIPRLNEIFAPSKDEKVEEQNAKYRKLFELLKDESIGDFETMIQTLPRAIETYFTQQQDKHSIIEVDIEQILGK